MEHAKLFGLLLALAMTLTGCAAVAGAGFAGAVYESKAKEAMDELEAQYQDGEISREEYLRRREEISERSLTQ